MSALDFNREEGFLFPAAEQMSWTQESELRSALEHAHSIHASDIYFTSGRPIVARVHGRLVRMSRRRLDHEHVRMITTALYGGDNAETEIRQGKALDNAYAFPVSRFEALRYRWCATGILAERGFGINIVMRELSETPPALDVSDLGQELLEALFPDDGLVLVCGETGAGKSTFLAGTVRHKAEQPDADCHIVEFSAPIEYVYHKIKTVSCEIEQSAIPENLADFPNAIRNALRRDPDIIIVGESRDAETIKASILAAQTGHAVYTTVHANSVGATFLRLLQTLPPDEAASIIGSIIDNIRVIICQRLMPSTDGKRVAVREYLVFNHQLRMELLRTAATNLARIPERAAQLVREYGQTKSQHAWRLVEAGRLDRKYAEILSAQDSSDAERVQRTDAGEDASHG
jgi:defect-in-organelle-trafficking protein DotB